MSNESFTKPPGVSDAEWEAAIAEYQAESAQRQTQTKSVDGFRFTKNLGSTLAIVLGVLTFVSGIPSPSSNAGVAGLVTGPVIIIGALACRSAKWRRLAGARYSEMDQSGIDPTVRKVLEAFALCAVAAAILFKKNLSYLIATEPVHNFIIPLWIYVAYTLAGSSKYLHDVSLTRDGINDGAILKPDGRKPSSLNFLLASIIKTVAVVAVFTGVVFVRLWFARHN